MSRLLKILSIVFAATLMLAACGSATTTAPASGEEQPPQERAAPADEAPADEAEKPAAVEEESAEESTGAVVFFSTQFTPVEEQEKFRAILQEGGFDVTASEEGPLLDVIIAGQQASQGDIDVIGALHGTFPPLARQDAMMNVIDVAEDLLDTRDLTQAYLETGLLGADDYLYYVPWMQATYIMAAHKDALQYLP
ncbi:MAG: hypothetical protein MI924_23010, partial [Chloroflexales bacterium]|nr:hypothetical protein [Chloroflexales bacterium]